MASTQFLNQRDEDDLHKVRLLAVEEKPFKRITRRLLTPGSLTSTQRLLPTPPPDGKRDEADEQSAQEKLDELRQFKQEVQLDFAAFDSSIVRIQFLRNSNARERQRYADEKIRILDAAQAVRDSTAELRDRLDQAKATLRQKKEFDDLADRITSNRLLRPREDQAANLRKLEEECRALEEEREGYAATWRERREQFGRLVDEGMQLRRLIRDEKDEVERREGMDDGEEEDGEVGESTDQATSKPGSISGNATPRPDGDANTPAEDGEKTRSSRLSAFASQTGSRSASRASSRVASPAGSDRREEPEEGEDVEMGDDHDKRDGEAMDTEGNTSTFDTPRVMVEEPAETRSGDKMEL